ncbi:hypothetical protein GXW83_27030 [Streptacidiphilus sp. PB12-B1b]|uniref:hypothetical protein n=1 Tax=Streptacidiphilus sp. PB12-B1b TaxID=2705012 RepID=UPI0015F910B7|nr:hypothetical protein [Streptacidiphilus sp. PB12-B1b]QMU78814.1 hypothetical protein GXW83_27030 [Streptacidiphilus sp. PB12-B1b]
MAWTTAGQRIIGLVVIAFAARSDLASSVHPPDTTHFLPPLAARLHTADDAPSNRGIFLPIAPKPLRADVAPRGMKDYQPMDTVGAASYDDGHTRGDEEMTAFLAQSATRTLNGHQRNLISVYAR